MTEPGLSGALREALERVAESLQGILDIGKRDMSNPKYEGYFETAHNALANYRALPPSRQGAGG